MHHSIGPFHTDEDAASGSAGFPSRVRRRTGEHQAEEFRLSLGIGLAKDALQMGTQRIDGDLEITRHVLEALALNKGLQQLGLGSGKAVRISEHGGGGGLR